MIYGHAIQMLADVRQLLERGTISKADQAEFGTVLYCRVNHYYQRIEFDLLQPAMQAQFLHKTVGASVLEGKIMGIFHVWPEERADKKETVAS